ncbi:Homogentisate 1,2-dioxygenase [Stieleria maiorica]|uniref:Homogentisate 1,2-dioxygenase n=1 Tax=Stieleria maiorica TaxID=2795974 RepID=A0A5B9MNR1_9BACT|nr:homogentisate 1,2-dioxygenase [Stieleria maiorica]QEG01577.1 Homogentisate 1,2-dioxygenase [Stieleria maiorica]
MPFYHQLGEVPRKRHTVWRQTSGDLYHEHVMGSFGFSGPESLLYHLRPPTTVCRSKTLAKIDWKSDPDETLRMRHFQLAELPTVDSATLQRTVLLFNHHLSLSMVRPTVDDDFFYRNGQGDEVIYVSEGSGVLQSLMGELAFRQGDYIVIPRGILYRLQLTDGPWRLLIIESAGQIAAPKRYRNEYGQLLEHSPYCERDIRPPQALPIHDETGEFRAVVKQNNLLTEMVLDHHPLDVVGWDGFYYPWALSIHDFEPITGSLHQPPPVHQTFAADGFVVCSFVPRLFDYHPDAVPAPYNHSNVMSDEVIYYANDQFMSRRGIDYGSLTLHPSGLPHGPHPGRAEASIGVQRTDELAVMLDTFHPLRVAREALASEDPDYARSWLL